MIRKQEVSVGTKHAIHFAEEFRHRTVTMRGFQIDNSVDAIINLESSHCYGSMTKFLSEVYRVLRPDGHFLFSDHRDHDKLNLLREQLKDSSLRLVKETD